MVGLSRGIKEVPKVPKKNSQVSVDETGCVTEVQKRIITVGSRGCGYAARFVVRISAKIMRNPVTKTGASIWEK
jgi:hypothetical protein